MNNFWVMLVRYIHHYNVCLWRVDWLGHVIILRDYIILRIVLIKYYKSIFFQETMVEVRRPHRKFRILAKLMLTSLWLRSTAPEISEAPLLRRISLTFALKPRQMCLHCNSLMKILSVPLE